MSSWQRKRYSITPFLDATAALNRVNTVSDIYKVVSIPNLSDVPENPPQQPDSIPEYAAPQPDPVPEYTIQRRLYNPDKVTNYSLANKYIIIGLSHENSRTGAPIALENCLAFFQKHGYTTALTYAQNVPNKPELMKYLKNTAGAARLIPIVLCNTIVMGNYVKMLHEEQIPHFWFIHEWIDDDSFVTLNYALKDSRIYTYPKNMVFVCQKSKENFMNVMPFLANSLVVHNGFNVSSYVERASRVCPLIRNDTDIIISIIGTIDNRKNQQSFIDDVFYKCKQLYPRIKLVLIGKQHKPLLIKDGQSITIVGEVQDALPYIQQTDILVSYSRNEVLPLNIMEAMFCKKPVVTTDVGGISEMVENGVNGFLFPVNDHNACLEGLSKLIESPDLRKTFGEAGERVFYNKFDETIAFSKLLHLPHMVDQQT
jgi:glycosyltransferase involved in cell wall biosynthesis